MKSKVIALSFVACLTVFGACIVRCSRQKERTVSLCYTGRKLLSDSSSIVLELSLYEDMSGFLSVLHPVNAEGKRVNITEWYLAWLDSDTLRLSGSMVYGGKYPVRKTADSLYIHANGLGADGALFWDSTYSTIALARRQELAMNFRKIFHHTFEGRECLKKAKIDVKVKDCV